MPHPKHRLACLLAVLPLSLPAAAQVVLAPTTPQVGSSNPASPEGNVAHPATTPCVVSLYSNMAFNDYAPHPLTYTPACTGTYAKIVLSIDFTVTAGRQYDRTGTIFLGNTNIFFGTTAEPRSTLSPSWHVERDLTDYAALLSQPQTGAAFLGNIYNSTYNGGIYGNATLYFYPADTSNPVPTGPSNIYGLAQNNQTTFLNSFADKQAATLTLPRNVTRAYLDVISQSQSQDEFWYTNVPNNLTSALAEYGNTAFRETEITIDGTPAGVAPVYPWIYTGGIDPYLWEPITGLETLNLKPYRVDLSPFAGILSDGNPHTIAASVFNAASGFSEAANLLVYTDPNTTQVTGGLISNTLTATPGPQVEAYIGTAADGTTSGPVNVQSFRAWQISGYIDTAAGRTTTTITANNSFKNNQNNNVSSTVFEQEINQEADQQEVTTITSPSGTTQSTHIVNFPLVVNYRYAPDDNNDGGYYQTTYAHQQKYEYLQNATNGNTTPPAVTHETVESNDTLHFNANGTTTYSNNNAKSSYGSKDANYSCSYRELESQNLKLTHVEDSNNCSAVQ